MAETRQGIPLPESRQRPDWRTGSQIVRSGKYVDAEILGGTIKDATIETTTLRADTALVGPGSIIYQGTYNTGGAVATGTALKSFVIGNPGIPGGCTVWIEVIGTAGFAGGAVSVLTTITGGTGALVQNSEAAAAKWVPTWACAYHVFADATTDKSIVINSTSTANAYWRGMIRVWIEQITT